MFYAYWESYCTCKSYVWCEKYDTREAPNRQIRRLMEQDNKRLRDKAKRERNEEVRVCIHFDCFVIIASISAVMHSSVSICLFVCLSLTSTFLSMPDRSTNPAQHHRSFRVSVARAWNSLPTSITALTSLSSFKRQLKTFYLPNPSHQLNFSPCNLCTVS